MDTRTTLLAALVVLPSILSAQLMLDADVLEQMQYDVKYLASDRLEGREAGTPGEKLAADYIAAKFGNSGLMPYGDSTTYLQAFTFQAEPVLGPDQFLQIGRSTLKLDEAYPLISRCWFVDNGTGLRIDSVEFGEDEFVSVKISDDGSIAGANVGIYQYAATDTNTANTTILSTFTAAANKVTDIGQDLGATINGIVATTNGTIARINTDFLDVEVDLSSTAGTGANAQTLGAIDAFTITGGGASFQLAAQVDIAGKVSLGIDNVAVRNIGQAEIEGEVKFLSDLSSGKGLDVVDGDLTGAQKVVEKAIREVSQLRGRLGAFQQNTIGATVRSLNIGLENTTAAESIIRDADFAFETADLTRNQILSASAQQILGLANSQPQAALQLLG